MLIVGQDCVEEMLLTERLFARSSNAASLESTPYRLIRRRCGHFAMLFAPILNASILCCNPVFFDGKQNKFAASKHDDATAIS